STIEGMSQLRTLAAASGLLMLTAGVWAQQRPAAPVKKTTSIDVAAALTSVVPDLDRRLAQFKQVQMPFTGAGLSARDRQVVTELVTASQWLERAYWRQSDPQGLALYTALEHDMSPLAAKVRRYLIINGSRFDLVDDNKPFIGRTPMPPGHALYPP